MYGRKKNKGKIEKEKIKKHTFPVITSNMEHQKLNRMKKEKEKFRNA